MHNADSAASPLNNPNSPFYTGAQQPKQQQQAEQPASAWSKVMGYVNSPSSNQQQTPSQPASSSRADKCPVMHDRNNPSSPLNNPNSPFYIAPSAGGGADDKPTQMTIPSHPQQPPQTTPEESPDSSSSWTAKLNPLNYMPTISNTKTSPTQTIELKTERMSSSIPRADPTADGEGSVWDYPSPQQMYNAVIRKGHTDTDPSGIPAMVAVHNWLNEGTWAEVERWDSVFRGRTLWEAWKMCAKGRENLDEMLEKQEEERERMAMVQGAKVNGGPKLERFQGRPGELTPRARMYGVLGRMFPQRYSYVQVLFLFFLHSTNHELTISPLSKFCRDVPPFDRHDWYVQRQTLRGPITMRYVIDFYSCPPEPDGMPAFNVDIRPALDSPRAASERFIMWAGDFWWRMSGGVVREAERRKREMEGQGQGH